MEKIIYADRLKAHYSWLGEDTPLTKKDLDDIIDKIETDKWKMKMEGNYDESI